jgi:hypothetical protein
MSYVVNVFRAPDGPPWPDKFQEALELTDRLFDERANANWRFRRFVSKLTRRYPDITSPEAQDMPEEELAWIDGPLNGNTADAVYNLGVGLDRLEEVRPFVIKAARDCGLGVRDDQAGEIYLSIKRAFNARGTMQEAGLPAREAGVPDRLQLLEIASDRLAPVFARHGFRRSTRPDEGDAYDATRFFRQDFPLGFHLLRLKTFADEGRTNVELIVESQFAPVTSELRRILSDGKAPGSLGNASTTWLQQDAWLPDPKGLVLDDYGQYVLSSPAAIGPALDHLEASFASRLAPLLHRYQTLHGFDALMNPTWDSIFFGGSHEFNLAPLVSAALARNPDLPRIVEEYEQFGAENRKQRTPFADAFERLDKVVAWMRNAPPARG